MGIQFPFLETLFYFLGIGLPVLILLQLWNRRSKIIKVPSVFLWNRIIKNNNIIRKPKLPIWNRIFILQLLLLLFLFVLGLSPFFRVNTIKNYDIVLVVDLSASLLTQSPPHSNRFDKLKSEILDMLDSINIKENDKIHLYLSPDVNNKSISTNLNGIINVIQNYTPTELPFDHKPLYNLANKGDRMVLLTDGVSNIPHDLRLMYEIVTLKDQKKINVGWTYFKIEESTTTGIIHNFSDIKIKADVVLSVDGNKSEHLFEIPLLDPHNSHIFTINNDIIKAKQYFELSLTAAGDSFEPDNNVAATVQNKTETFVYIKDTVSPKIEKVLEALGGYTITKFSDNLKDVSTRIDLVVSDKIEYPNTNHLVVSPKNGSELWRVKGVLPKSSKMELSPEWKIDLGGIDQANINLEGVREIESLSATTRYASSPELGQELLFGLSKGSSRFLIVNFDVNGSKTWDDSPLFPVLISKCLEELNNKDFGYYCVGDIIIPPYLVSEARIYQNIRKNSTSRVVLDPGVSEKLLDSSGIFVSNHDILCVNHLNFETSSVNNLYDLGNPSKNAVINEEWDSKIYEWKPFILSLIAFIFILEALLYRNRRF